MASNHSTCSSCAAKAQRERRLTVHSINYEYPPTKDAPPKTGKRIKQVPWLQMKGIWLEKAGFHIDTPIRVRVMEGCLVLTAETEE